MKPLDEYIKNNREQFDSGEPLPGHFDRLEERLGQAGRKKLLRPTFLLRIAAAVLFCALITYGTVIEFQSFNRNMGSIISKAEYPELKEAEYFYNDQLDNYYNKLENLKYYDEAQKRLIMDELSSMDRQALNIKKDLKLNPDNERVQNAIINYYQVKLEFMDMIISRALESKQTIL